MPYIFVSSIGRSGTKFISELFEKVTDYPSFHENQPYCYGQTYIDINQGKRHIPELHSKVRSIKKLSKDGNYFESSHLFLRSFSQAVTKNFSPVYVIHLTRDPLETARSYSNRDSVPGHKDRPFRLPLNLKKSLLHLPKKELSRYQKNLCDWLENEMRYDLYSKNFTKTFDLYYSDINNIKVWQELFKHFDIPYNNDELVRILTTANSVLKNKNYQKTQLLYSDLEFSRDLIELIKRYKVNVSIFRKPYYQEYQWIKELLDSIDGKQLPELQPFEDPPIIMQKKRRRKPRTKRKSPKIAELNKIEKLTKKKKKKLVDSGEILSKKEILKIVSNTNKMNKNK